MTPASGDPRSVHDSEGAGDASDEPGRSTGEDPTVEGDAREEEQELQDTKRPGSMGGDNGGA